MSDKDNAEDNLLATVTKSALSSTITGALGYIISTSLGLTDDAKTAVVGFSVLLGSLIITFIKKRVVTFSDDLGKKYLEEKTGIIEVYPSLQSCKNSMQNDFKKSKDIRMLLQVGRREFGDSEPSYFWSLAKEKTDPTFSIRVLRASVYSPFLSEARANYRGNDIRRWHQDLNRLKNELQLLKDIHKSRIEDREHQEPYLWRIFLFDNIAYVSAYCYQSDNDQKAFVYKITKGDDSLYDAFSKYFDYLWLKYDPQSSSNLDEKWAKWI